MTTLVEMKLAWDRQEAKIKLRRKVRQGINLFAGVLFIPLPVLAAKRLGGSSLRPWFERLADVVASPQFGGRPEGCCRPGGV